tara:strand:- start:1106 stop:1543 length:438 start_codon:yes stop_codon:yes gene_type:complete
MNFDDFFNLDNLDNLSDDTSPVYSAEMKETKKEDSVSWQNKTLSFYNPSPEFYAFLIEQGIVKTDIKKRVDVFCMAYSANHISSEKEMYEMIDTLLELVLAPVAIEYTKKTGVPYQQVKSYKIPANQVAIFANVMRNYLLGTCSY